ncbi:excinuclease ABC subunit A [Cognatishimia activa]|uniref:Excinuclease ABC subunit A n=1 Tax=Cognatishimia activa TaxID=1715691 RepID=A0A975ENW0_9RHOB|nr:excinuclease ABC subunit A [Cognatishimia activa]QTN35419.1 excinuclease ABC subunit A [Cognatishimia activa]
MTHDKSIKSLKITIIASAGFALFMFASLFTPLREVMSFFLDLVHMPLDGAQNLSRDTEEVLTAISAGIFFGFCVLLWQVTTEVYVKDPLLGRRMILSSVIAWYVIDTTGSLIVGAWMNGILNTVFLIALISPVLRQQEKLQVDMV